MAGLAPRFDARTQDKAAQKEVRRSDALPSEQERPALKPKARRNKLKSMVRTSLACCERTGTEEKMEEETRSRVIPPSNLGMAKLSRIDVVFCFLLSKVSISHL